MRIPTEWPVGLGYLYDSRRGMVSFVPGLSPECINQNTSATPSPSLFQKLDKSLVESSSSRVMTIVGQLVEINASLAVVDIKGKAYVDLKDINDSDSATLSFYNYAVKETRTLDTSKIQPKDLTVTEFSEFTHIVTDTCLGRFLYGDITLTSKTDRSDLKVGGELKVSLMSIPIGGTGKIDFDKSEFDAKYNFEAKIQAKGLNFEKGLLNASDLTTFVESVETFVTSSSPSDNSAIVKVFMTPLSGIKSLESNKPLLCTTVIANMAKRAILDGRDLVDYIDTALVPFLTEKRRLDLVKQAETLKNTTVTTMITVENTLAKCRTEDQVIALSALCEGAEYYTVDLWGAITSFEELHSFVGENTAEAVRKAAAKKAADDAAAAQESAAAAQARGLRVLIISGKSPEKCIGLQSGTRESNNGEICKVWDIITGSYPPQEWIFDGLLIKSAKSPGKCIHLESGLRALNNGDKCQVWDIVNGVYPPQEWHLRSIQVLLNCNQFVLFEKKYISLLLNKFLTYFVPELIDSNE